MNKSEAYSGILNRLKPIFLERGFTLNKNKTSAFLKKTEYGYQRFYFDISDYNPKQKIGFGVCISHDKIESIIKLINEKFQLETFSDLRDTIGWGYPYSLGTSVNKCQVTNEADFDKCIDYIYKHLEKYIFPFYDRFCDLINIDKEVNGKDFWKTDWQKPYSFVGLFPFKRTIIAYLCSNPRINDIKAYHIKEWEDALIKYPNCKNLLDAYGYLFEYFKDVQPLNKSNHE